MERRIAAPSDKRSRVRQKGGTWERAWIARTGEVRKPPEIRRRALFWVTSSALTRAVWRLSDLYHTVEVTGDEGSFTQWVHCEFVVSFEAIHPVVTQQVCGEFF